MFCFKGEQMTTHVDESIKMTAAGKTADKRKRKLAQNEAAVLPKSSRVSKNGASDKRVWTANEKQALEHLFARQIRLEKVPGKLDCINAQMTAPCLSTISWKKIKFAVYNIIKSSSRKTLQAL